MKKSQRSKAGKNNSSWPVETFRASNGERVFSDRPLPAAPILYAPAFAGSGGDRVQWTKQGAAAGAALRFLQAPAAARRKNRLSARGTNGDRVLWTMQGAVRGAVLQFLQGHSCSKKKLAKHKRTVASATGAVNTKPSPQDEARVAVSIGFQSLPDEKIRPRKTLHRTRPQAKRR